MNLSGNENIDLDAMFNMAAPSPNQTTETGVTNGTTTTRIPIMPPGALVKITFKQDSLMCLAFKAAQARDIANEKERQQQSNQNSTHNTPQQQQQQQQQQQHEQQELDQQKGGSDEQINSKAALDDLFAICSIHGLVIDHSDSMNTLQIRIYDMDKPYNVQSQAMIILNLGEIQNVEFISMIQNNLLGESLSQDFIDMRIAAGAERRLKMKQLINPSAGQYGQDLAVYLARTVDATRWFNLAGDEEPRANYPDTPYDDRTTLVIDRICIVKPYSHVNVMGWDNIMKRPITKEIISNEFIVNQIIMFENEYRRLNPNFDFRLIDAEVNNNTNKLQQQSQQQQSQQQQSQQQSQQKFYQPTQQHYQQSRDGRFGQSYTNDRTPSSPPHRNSTIYDDNRHGDSYQDRSTERGESRRGQGNDRDGMSRDIRSTAGISSGSGDNRSGDSNRNNNNVSSQTEFYPKTSPAPAPPQQQPTQPQPLPIDPTAQKYSDGNGGWRKPPVASTSSIAPTEQQQQQPQQQQQQQQPKSLPTSPTPPTPTPTPTTVSTPAPRVSAWGGPPGSITVANTTAPAPLTTPTPTPVLPDAKPAVNPWSNPNQPKAETKNEKNQEGNNGKDKSKSEHHKEKGEKGDNHHKDNGDKGGDGKAHRQNKEHGGGDKGGGRSNDGWKEQKGHKGSDKYKDHAKDNKPRKDPDGFTTQRR